MSFDEFASQAPADRYVDPVIEYYKQFVDRKALRENLKLTVEQRLNRMMAMQAEAQRNLDLARAGAGG